MSRTRTTTPGANVYELSSLIIFGNRNLVIIETL